MKRQAGSDFDEDGAKWFQSPNYKEVKTEVSAEESAKMKEYSKRFTADSDKETKLKRERFYDLFTRLTNDEKFKINIEELNLSLNLRIDDFPDDYKITAIFEELNSKSAMISRGKKNWSEQETYLCIWIVMAYCNLNDRDFNDMTDKDWDGVARMFPGKSAEQCKVRWQGLLKTNLTKAPWTQEEDKILSNIILEKGPKKWKEIACELNKKMADNKVFRQGKQCRERWINHLDPAINRGAWTSDEDIKLLETHLSIGKKWAEISKVLKTRTENAVKNRWNSLMKKYKGEFDLDVDTMSTSSAYSNKSMDDLERKIAVMIISRRGKDSKSNSPDLVSPGNKIVEVNEDDSPDNYSDISAETPYLKTEDSMKGYSRQEELERNDSKGSQKKGAAANKKKPVTSVHAAKTFLREMITEEIQNQPQGQTFPPNNANDVPLSKAEQAMLAQKMYSYDDNPNTANQEQVMSSQGPYNSAPMPLYNQQLPSENRSNMINMTNEINMWRNNLNNMNIFTQSPQQTSLSSNLLGIYSPNSFLHHQPGFNLASAILPVDSLNQNNSRDNKLIKLNDAKPELPPAEPKIHKLIERPINQFAGPENGQQLFYAVVDLSGNSMYLLDQVNKDNYPPALGQAKEKMQTSLNNLDFFGNSPSINHASWKSPPINTNALSNYPLFNNALNSFGLGKNPFSPNLFANAPQFDQNMFESTPKMESVGGVWTPEQRPLFQGLTNMKQYYANAVGDTPPDMKFGSGALFGRIDPTKINAGAVANSTEGGLKYSSPSSFLQSSQPSHLNRNAIKTGFEKI